MIGALLLWGGRHAWEGGTASPMGVSPGAPSTNNSDTQTLVNHDALPERVCPCVHMCACVLGEVTQGTG